MENISPKISSNPASVIGKEVEIQDFVKLPDNDIDPEVEKEVFGNIIYSLKEEEVSSHILQSHWPYFSQLAHQK